jgi:hypothetical protein
MVLENYWKILKDNKLLSETLSIAAVDRELAKGTRSAFELNLPD